MTYEMTSPNQPVKWGLVLPNFGPLGDTRLLADLAHIAEEAGWDGFFLPDTIQMQGTANLPATDAWIDLAAIAMRTERIRIGLMVAAVTRYRPWHLARLAASVDQLSGGRLILGVGSGDPHDTGFAAFGEEMDPKRRAAMLDESLDILQGLWSGRPFGFQGAHYSVNEIALLPAPVQSPRIPIWVGWTWPNRRPMARAARWDGAVPFTIDEQGEYANLTPADIRQLREYVDGRREEGSPFEIVSYGPVLAAHDDGEALAGINALGEAGATWIIDFVPPDTNPDDLRRTIFRGVPALARAVTAG